MSALLELENDIGMGMGIIFTMKSLQDWQWLTSPVFQFNLFKMMVMVMGTKIPNPECSQLMTVIGQ
jgi:hypothetical protein